MNTRPHESVCLNRSSIPSARPLGFALAPGANLTDSTIPQLANLQGVFGAPPQVPVSALRYYADDWISNAEFTQSPNTVAGKRGAFDKLFWFLKKERIDNCGAHEIRRFLAHVKNYGATVAFQKRYGLQGLGVVGAKTVAVAKCLGYHPTATSSNSGMGGDNTAHTESYSRLGKYIYQYKAYMVV